MMKFQPAFTGIALAALCASAAAAPVSINGALGAEWSGVSSVTVTHDDNAPDSNFGAPTNTTRWDSYTIQMRADAGYVYVGMQTVGAPALSASLLFANLYFDVDPLANNGSDIGFEVTNNTWFIAGGPGGFDATPYLTWDNASNPGTIEVAIDRAFFTGVFQGLNMAPGDVVLRLSQSFGYSVAGGASYGDDRLGRVSLAELGTVPEPGSLALVMAALAGVGFAARLKAKAAGPALAAA